MSPELAESPNLELLLRICSLVQSVRALYNAGNSAAVRRVFEKHFVELILELVRADDAAILIEQYGEARVDKSLLDKAVASRTLVEEELDGRYVVIVPLMVRNEVAGVIFLSRERSPFGETESLLLAAVAQLGSVALENAFQMEWLESEVKRLESGPDLEKLLAGTSTVMRALRDRIARVGPTEATVLITGESGTGKELVARALHQKSLRSSKPFAAINCGALTETLLESELFGHEKGAFTGAFVQKRGRLESADGGTLFLDEIGEMPLSLQVKLLRVLQQREFERVGGTRTMKLDVRFIAATNRNLPEEIRKGSFRQDLFYRLNVVSLQTPALRERVEDILPLATRFTMQFGERCGREVHGISPEARALLRTYEWPGNVRELENAIECAVVMGSTDYILAEDLPDVVRGGNAQPRESSGMLQDAVQIAKRSVVRKAFELANQDHNQAARLLGVHPNYLYRLLRSMGE